MQQIIALGGGGFSMEPDNQALDQYIVEQASKARPKVCFLPSATDDAVRYIRNFYEAFTKLDTRPTYLSLFTPPTADLESFLLGQDVIYVGGCPHYDGEAERRPTFHRLLIEGEIKPGLALEDGAAAHFVDDQLIRVVSSRPYAKAYALKMIADEVQESPIESEYLLR